MTAIPLPIQEIYKELQTELTWLHGRWSCYTTLFEASQARIDLLNESGSAFFYVIERMLLDDVMVTMSRVTDPPSTGKSQNLSFPQLQERLVVHAPGSLAAATAKLLAALQVLCEGFRLWRNKTLAHLDVQTILLVSPNPLPGITRKMIDDALAVARDILNEIERHYYGSEVDPELPMLPLDAEEMLDLLKSGHQYRQLQHSGAIPFEDTQARRWNGA